MKYFVLVSVFVGISMLDLPRLYRRRMWGEFIVVSVLLFLGFTLSILQIMEVNVPNPNKGIEVLIKIFQK